MFVVDGLGWVCVIVRSVVRNHSASVLLCNNAADASIITDDNKTT